MGNLCPCRPNRMERYRHSLVRAVMLGNWPLVVSEMVASQSRPESERLTPYDDEFVIFSAMSQNQYMQIPTLLDLGYTFTQQQLEHMIKRAAEEKQMKFLVYMLCTFRQYTFSWPCVVRALDAFASQDEYLDRAKYFLLTRTPPDADMSLLEPIHARLQERHSDKSEMKDFVLKQMSDLIKG